MNEVTPEREHALLSASSAKIWLSCPPSARESEKYEDKGSEFADEGTAAHALAEAVINQDPEAIARAKTSKHYNGEMEEAIAGYAAFITERFNAAKAKTPDAILFTEQRLDYSEWAPEGFGTGDVLIIADGTMEVIDLKYGTGVPVSATDNPQLRLYGLGALGLFSTLYDIDTVSMTICQPRRDSISTESLSAADLVAWADEYVKPRATQAWDGDGEYSPGEHCRFCKALPHCRALADYNLELARYEFKPGNELTVKDIADILQRSDLLVQWAGKVAAYALDEAVNHEVAYPGYKLVEGRSVRKYTDQDKVAKALKGAGYDEALLYERSLLGITNMEKLVGKKRFTEVLGPLVQKAPGAPTLVPETDKRAALNSTQSAIADFTDAPDTGDDNN